MSLRVLVLTPIYPWPGDPPEGIFIQRQVQNLVRHGVQCRVLMYTPAVRYLPPSMTALSHLRYHPRWMIWPKAPGGVSSAHVFYPRRHKGEDVIPAVSETLRRFLDAHSEFRDNDVVYAHWLWTGGAAALRLRDQFGWPVAAIARGSEMHDWHDMHRHCRPHVERVLSQADMILANCDGLRRRAGEIAPGASGEMKVVYNGCDARVFRPCLDKAAVRSALQLPLDSKLLLCCASIIER
ncbi:MAG TPA: glycosyltransferase, partial [Gemmatimonadaceae bacterium]